MNTSFNLLPLKDLLIFEERIKQNLQNLRRLRWRSGRNFLCTFLLLSSFIILSYFFLGWKTIETALYSFPGCLGLLMMSIIGLIIVLSFLRSFKALLKVASAPNYEHQLNKTLNLFGGLWIGSGGEVEVPLKGKPLLELWNSYRAEYRKRKEGISGVSGGAEGLKRKVSKTK